MKSRHIDYLLIGLVVVLAIMLSGCKLQRNVQKEVVKQEQTVTTSNQTDITRQDNTITTTTTRSQDTVITPPVNMSAIGIGNVVTTVHDGDTLKATFDPVNKVLQAHFSGGGKKVAVDKETVTQVKADVKETVSKKADSTGTTATVTRTKNKQTTTSWQWLWFVLGGLGVVVGVVVYRKVKKVINMRINPP